MIEILDWAHRAADIPEGGLENRREASEAERAAVAEALDLKALRQLNAKYRITGVSGGGYRLTGTLSGDLDQACVVTLEPVSSKLNAAFEVEFWPEARANETDEEASVLSGPDVEPLENGTIPVGRIVFETLSASLDPYPRAAGAEFEWTDPQSADPEKTSPFAALSRLKGREE